MNNQPEKAGNQQKDVNSSQEKRVDPFDPDKNNDPTVTDPDKRMQPVLKPESKEPLITDPNNIVADKSENNGNGQSKSDESTAAAKKS